MVGKKIIGGKETEPIRLRLLIIEVATMRDFPSVPREGATWCVHSEFKSLMQGRTFAVVIRV